jgi:aminopeptidase N
MEASLLALLHAYRNSINLPKFSLPFAKIQLLMRSLLLLLVIFVSNFVFGQAYNPQVQDLDVQHYRFALTFTDQNNSIEGEAQVRIRFKRSLSQFQLDLVAQNGKKGMNVSQISVNGNKLDFKHTGEKLSINLPATAKEGETHTFTISYAGEPADGLIIDANKYGERTFFGDNWPNRAHHWLPCVDHPSDKASVEFIVTAPIKYQVIGNGLQIEESVLLDGLNKRTHWRETVNLPTKVMVVGAAPFSVQLAGEVRGIPISSWVFSKNREEGFADYSLAVRVLDWFVEHIGPYPYRKLANVQSKTRYGGMENASNIFYFENSVNGKQDKEALIAHEIAHQWFGNSASEANWFHVWLSESFATYCTDLYWEHRFGQDALAERMREERQTVMRYAQRKLAPIVDTTVTDINQVLNPNSYQKGAWVLHMLRQEIGDDRFREGVRTYYARYAGSNALTRDLQQVFEEVSGKNLSAFFQQWVFSPGHPELKLEWTYNAAKKQVEGSITQTQAKPFTFKLEMEARNADCKGLEIKTIELSKAKETFTWPLDKAPNSVILDPGTKLLFKQN